MAHRLPTERAHVAEPTLPAAGGLGGRGTSSHPHEQAADGVYASVMPADERPVSLRQEWPTLVIPFDVGQGYWFGQSDKVPPRVACIYAVVSHEDRAIRVGSTGP